MVGCSVACGGVWELESGLGIEEQKERAKSKEKHNL